MNRSQVYFVVEGVINVPLLEGLAEVCEITLQEGQSTPDRRIEGAGTVWFTREVFLHDDRSRMIEPVDSLAVLQRIPRFKTL